VANFFLGILGLCAIIGYTAVNGWLASSTAQSVAISQRQLELSERPWLAVEQPTIIHPLTFDKRYGASAIAKFLMKNIGHSGAEHVATWARLVACRWPSFNLAIAEQVRHCDKIRDGGLGEVSSDPMFTGFFLFPDEEMSVENGVTLSEDEIHKAKGHFPGEAPEIMIALVGCVDYQSELDKRHHQTRFAYALAKRGGFVTMSPIGIHADLETQQIPEGNSAD